MHKAAAMPRAAPGCNPEEPRIAGSGTFGGAIGSNLGITQQATIDRHDVSRCRVTRTILVAVREFVAGFLDHFCRAVGQMQLQAGERHIVSDNRTMLCNGKGHFRQQHRNFLLA
jgi:hypothetical protein